MLRVPHCLDNWLVDGSKVVSPMHWRAILPRNIIIFVFPVLISVNRLSELQNLVQLEGLGKLKVH
jgi:hypothetical protein